MMSEHIELRSYTVLNTSDGDNIEEYHEIEPDNAVESLEIFVSNISPETINDYDFFTQLDSTKRSTKKKKSKKKANASNVMDIIISEIASMTVPITVDNVVEIVDDKGEYYRNYVQSYSRDHREFRRRRPFVDSEHGFPRRSRTENLNPIFPNLLENIEQEAPNIPVEYIPPITFDELLEHTLDNRKHTTKFIDIALRNIMFKHHHEFSLEDLLCVKLIENYNLFKKINDKLKDLSREIKVNRETKDNLKRDFIRVSPNKKNDIRFDATVRKYTGKLLDLKVQYREAMKDHKDITHKIISTWCDIEMIREKFECKDTPYNLRINKQTLNKKEYDNLWRETFEVEFNDMLAKIEYDFTTKCIEYKERKSFDGKKIPKPKMNINEDLIKEEVEGIVNNSIQRDVIDFILEKDSKNYITKISENVYHLEVYVDKVFVCESKRYNASDWNNNVNFSECFSVEVLPENEILRIVLVENNEKVSHIKVYLSELQTHKNDGYTEVEFVYDKHIDPKCNYIGSGHSIKEIAAVNNVRLKSSNTLKGNLTTACKVGIQIKLNESVDENLNEAIKESLNIGNKLRRLMHGVDKPNVEVLTEIIGKVYGRDVSNDETIIKTLKRLCKMEVNTEKQFPIDQNSPEYVRFKLLHLRNSGGFTNVENKMVPIHGSQISTEQLNCLHKTKSKNFDLNYLKAKETDMDPIELQRFISAKFIHKLNMKMLKNLNEHLMVKTQKDVVREFRDFSLRSLFSRQNNGNSSASISNSAKHQILMDSLTKEQEIHITVQRAFNLLDRSTDLMEEVENDEDTIAGYKVRPLRPFVRVSYHNTTAQTVTAIGCHPTWNHTLKLNTKMDPLSNVHIDVYDACKVNISEGLDDGQGMTFHYRYFNKWLGTVQVPLFTVLSLGSLRGTFKINTPPVLFGYEMVQNKESHSLIPEITQLMKKETSYIALHVTTGLAHLGGFQEFTQPLPSSVEDDYLINHLNTFVTDYTNDFPYRNLSLSFIDSGGRNKCVTQFLQPIPCPDRECFPFNPKSCGSAMSKSSGFSRSSSSKSSGKKNEEEESMYSQENWKGDGLVKTINACLRFVALIPSYEVCDTHVITLMGLELLKVLHGSPLDHTLLLSSYFLYLGVKSWVGIGLGLPRGRSSYVLIQYDITARRFVLTGDELFRSRGILHRNEGYLWYVCDAVSGDRFELRDVGCPMKTVDYLFDNENIWVNVQSSQDCQNVSFDLSKTSDWQTVFDKEKVFVMKHPIVNDPNLYTSPCNVESLRRALEIKIKGKVQKWRPHVKTIWNRYCSTQLRDSLPWWEYWAFNPSDHKPAFTQKLKQLMATYRMFGFPLNIPFVNTKSVISAVKATGVHVCDDPNVEFALGVEVYGYPNNVLSVWVYLASITRI